LDLMRVTGKSKNAERSRLKSWHWVARQYAFKLDITLDEISQIQLDPERMLADVDENNDQWKSE